MEEKLKPIKVAFECDPDLYEKFRRIYPGHGQVARFYRTITKRVVKHVDEHGLDGLGQAVGDIATSLVDEDIDRGRI